MFVNVRPEINWGVKANNAAKARHKCAKTAVGLTSKGGQSQIFHAVDYPGELIHTGGNGEQIHAALLGMETLCGLRQAMG